MDVSAVLLQYFEQTAPPQTCAEAVLQAAAEALRALLGAEEVRFVVRYGTLLKELTFPGQITRDRTENEDDIILACLAHCAGKPVCVCAQNGGKAEIGCFRFRRRAARYTAPLCAAYWESRRMRLWPEPSV